MKEKPTAIRLREAVEDDSMAVLQIRNDPVVVAMSLSGAAVGIDSHRAWFLKVLNDPTRRLCVIDADGEVVGSLRFDISDESAEVSIAIGSAHRGRGIAHAALAEGVSWAFRNGIAGQLTARVKHLNRRSTALFERAGFECVGADEACAHYLLVDPDVDHRRMLRDSCD